MISSVCVYHASFHALHTQSELKKTFVRVCGVCGGCGIPIDDVDHLEDLQEDHGVGQLTVELVLLGGVREVDDGPPDHADATDGEHLDVEVADARVQLHAHPEV